MISTHLPAELINMDNIKKAGAKVFNLFQLCSIFGATAKMSVV